MASSAQHSQIEVGKVIFKNKTLNSKSIERKIDTILEHGDLDHLELGNVDFKNLMSFIQYFESKRIKISTLEINGNKKMDPTAYRQLPAIVKKAKVKRLRMRQCDLNSAKLSKMLVGMKDRNVNLPSLDLAMDRSLKPEAFEHIVALLENAKVQCLVLEDCGLTFDKLASFREHITGKNIQLSQLSLDKNKNMNDDAFKEIAQIVEKAQIQELHLRSCDLNQTKLEAFLRLLPQKSVKLKSLVLSQNESMESTAFHSIAEIARNCELHHLSLAKCDLTDEKLSVLCKHLKDMQTKIPEMDFSGNRKMQFQGYRDIAEIIATAKVCHIWLCSCAVDKDKLASLVQTLTGKGAKVTTLNLHGNYLKVESFRLIVDLVQCTQTKELDLSSCSVTYKTLSVFREHLEKTSVKISKLHLSHLYKNMQSAGFQEIANITRVAEVEFLHLENCSIDFKKLRSFGGRLAGQSTKLKLLLLDSNKGILRHHHNIIDILRSTSVQRLSLRRCDITESQFRCFENELHKKDVTVHELDVRDNDGFDVFKKNDQVRMLWCDSGLVVSGTKEEIDDAICCQSQKIHISRKNAHGDPSRYSEQVMDEYEQATESGFEDKPLGSEEMRSLHADEKVDLLWRNGDTGHGDSGHGIDALTNILSDLSSKCRMQHLQELEASVSTLSQLGVASSDSLLVMEDQKDTNSKVIALECAIKQAKAETDSVDQPWESILTHGESLWEDMDNDQQHQLIMNCHEEIYTAYCALGKHREAADFCARAINVISSLGGDEKGHTRCMAKLQHNKGLACVSMHDISAARFCYEQATSLYVEAGCSDERFDVTRLVNDERTSLTSLGIVTNHD